MDHNNENQSGTVLPDNAEFGNVQNNSESFGKIPHVAERFGRIPNDAERFRSVPRASARNENHTLTVRDSARMFEAAGVARTERSIVNWCQPNKSGIARLDAYFDPNERRYFITSQSVESAIAEELAKAAKGGEPSEPDGMLRKGSEKPQTDSESHSDSDRSRELEKENLDLKITNRGKDFFIEQLQKERESFARERENYVEKLMSFNRQVGELEAKLHQLDSPKSSPSS